MMKKNQNMILFSSGVSEEIGLCSMALGMERVILLADDDVHLPEDLYGLNSQLALHRVVLNRPMTAPIRLRSSGLLQRS